MCHSSCLKTRVSVYSVPYWSKAKLCSSVWPSGHTVHMLLFLPSRGAFHLSLTYSLLLSLSPLCCHLNDLALSKKVHREEQKELLLFGNHSQCNTLELSNPLFCIPSAQCTCSFSCLFVHSHPPPVFILESSTSSSVMQKKTVPL